MKNERFEMNGKTYVADSGTLEMLRSIVPSAKQTGDGSAVQVAMFLGLMTGRIIEAYKSQRTAEGICTK